MSPNRQKPKDTKSSLARRAVGCAGRGVRVVGSSLLLLSAVLVAQGALASSDEHGQEGAPVPKGDVQVATSVCEAHALRAAQEENPAIQIEIPPEFAGQWPSGNACLSAELAWDVEAPGPMQPIPFSHKHHSGEFGLDCQYCHSNTGDSPTAGMPSVELCMGCHAQFPKSYDEIEGIRILKQHWENKEPIEWIQIHRLPEYVQFRHNRHIAADVPCQRCHGQVEEMDKLYLVPESFWRYGVPVNKLEMGWCIECHRDNHNQADIDCVRCHY